MTFNLADYVLVKDKDGRLKYYKDGKYFSVEEIRAEREKSQKHEVKKEKIDLQPIFSYETKDQYKEQQALKSVTAGVLEEIKKEAQAPAPETKINKNITDLFATIEKEPMRPLGSSKEDIEINQLPVHPDYSERREQDQQIISAKVDYVIEKLKIQFSDPIIKNRFLNVLITYFRGIRGKKEIEYILTLPKTSGGLGLNDKQASLVLAVLDVHLEDAEKLRKGVATQNNKTNIPNDAIQSVTPDYEHQLAPPPPAIIKKDAVDRLRSAERSMGDNKQMTRPTMVKPSPVIPNKNIVQKAKINDIQASSRATGPIQELEYMTLEDFHLLGKNAKEIENVILEKIELLSQDSLAKKVEGIKAWKRSPVVKIYFSMNMEGMSEGKSIQQVIESRQLTNKETLTISEYELITRLNQLLRL